MTPTGPTEQPADGHVVLGGKYVLGDVLGTGGTYTVYEASRVQAASAAPAADGDTSGDGVASGGGDPDGPTSGAEGEPAILVKVLHPHLVDDDAARAALAREIAASKLVDHPGVAKVLDTGEDEVAGSTVPWILTRRLPGTPLSEMAAGDGLPWRESLALVHGLLAALAAVHAAGLVHRDVGPRNVVLERRDDGGLQVGLLDLGLTAPAGGDGDGELVAGSVVCMSPEQAQGRPLDARSDLYSVGALAYFALTGHAPYERARPDDVARAHVEAPVPAPSARRATVPGGVDRFVARAMAKDPDRRFTSADEMRAAAATLLGTGAAVAAAGTADSDETMTLGQIAEEDPHRTAVVGAAGAAAAAAALAAADDDAEIQRTRQLGAVGAAGAAGAAAQASTPAEGVPVAADEDADALPEEPEEESAPGRKRWLIIALVLVLAAAAAGAVAFWPRDAGDPAPVPVVSSSPSPSRSPSPTPTETATTAPPPSEPTTRPTPSPTPTSSPSPSPSATPSEEPSEEPSEDPTPTDEPSEDPTSTPDPTPTETEDPAPPPPEPSSDPTDDAAPSSAPTAGGSSGGGSGSGSAP